MAYDLMDGNAYDSLVGELNLTIQVFMEYRIKTREVHLNKWCYYPFSPFLLSVLFFFSFFHLFFFFFLLLFLWFEGSYKWSSLSIVAKRSGQ